MFCQMLRIVARDSATRLATSATRPWRIAASAVSSATSVPPPIAIPTSAAASAGASLMPSPTWATICPSARSASTMRCLSAGRSSAQTAMPSAPPMAAAVQALSPVSITVAMPASRSARRPAAASGRGSSRTAMRPAASSPETRTDTVLPASLSAAIRDLASSPRATCSSAAAGESSATASPPTLPATPLPGKALAFATGGTGTLSAFALARIARASGWLEPVSSAAASDRSFSSGIERATTSVTCGLPSVSVPVLSKATVVTLRRRSRIAPPLTSRPRRAPADSPAAIAAGVEMTSAQGQPISRIARPL